jgi:hypothetical protein
MRRRAAGRSRRLLYRRSWQQEAKGYRCGRHAAPPLPSRARVLTPCFPGASPERSCGQWDDRKWLEFLERETGFEPATPSLGSLCSTS